MGYAEQNTTNSRSLRRAGFVIFFVFVRSKIFVSKKSHSNFQHLKMFKLSISIMFKQYEYSSTLDYNYKKTSTPVTHRATVLDLENVLWLWTLWNTCPQCIYTGRRIQITLCNHANWWRYHVLQKEATRKFLTRQKTFLFGKKPIKRIYILFD